MKIRIYKLALKLNISTKELLELTKKFNMHVTSHLSAIDDNDITTITKYLTKPKETKKVFSTASEKIKNEFAHMRNIDDFTKLLNNVNDNTYGNKSHHIKKQHLTYHAFHSKIKYKIFEIPKKSGGTREIFAPNKGLKHILSTLNIIFQNIYKTHMVTHGFTKHRSVVTNAKHHVNKNYVFNIDLKDFFPSIHQARIWKRLQYPPFNLKNEKKDIANLIANLVCFQFEKNDINKKNFLPQGAPTSPIISNIICERLDRKLFELAKEHNLKYTRYADDMTFSSDHNVYQENSEFLQKLHEIIKSENFEINPKKTRLQKRGYKQEVTGLIVNEKVNVSRVYIKNLRMLIHLVVKHGEEKAQSIFEKHSAVAVADLKLVIQGKLNYLKMVKGKNDTTYMTLHTKYLDAYKLIEVEVADTKHQEKVKIGNKKEKIINNCEHNPKELVRILSKFSDQNSALKWCVHSEGYEELYKGDYIYFMNCLEKEFKEIEDDIRRFSNRMYGKIYGFLFEKKLSFPKENKKYNYTWGDNKLEFGWSSPELKDWCLQSSNHIPFKFKLEDKYKKEINGETLSKFLHITTAFKNEIEVRSDNDALFNLIENIREEVLYEKKFNLEYNEEEILGLDFYTDIQWLSKGLKKIFEEIAKRGEYKIIKIYVKKDKDHFSVYIEHTSSYSKKESNELSKEINNGDFQDIKKYFCSLCDWSVEAKCLDGNYRINYLKSQGVEEIEKLANEPKGFTHILRFYK